MQRIKDIKTKLDSLKPHYLEVIDESHLHKGHLGPDQLQETHVRITIAADVFAEISRVMQHKMINELLADEFKEGLHALSIKIIT